jgi:hypothetical protein
MENVLPIRADEIADGDLELPIRQDELCDDPTGG